MIPRWAVYTIGAIAAFCVGIMLLDGPLKPWVRTCDGSFGFCVERRR